MKTAQFIQAQTTERERKSLRPYDEFNLTWLVDYTSSGKVLVAHDDAGNKYTVVEESDDDFPFLLTITPPRLQNGRPQDLKLRCSWPAEAASYAEDYNWNRKIGYVAHGHVMGTITTCWK